MGWNPFRRQPKEPDLRAMWLTGERPAGPTVDGLHAVVVDCAQRRGGVSLCCAADGSVSVLNFDGGGTIGLGAKPAPAQAARELITAVAAHRAHMRPAADLDRPGRGRIAFIARSPEGIVRADGAEADLSKPAHPLHALFLGFHAVITAVRESEPTDVLLHADGGLAVKDPNNPTPTWLTIEQLREVLERCKQRGAPVRMHRPANPTPAARVVLDLVDAHGLTVEDCPPSDAISDQATTLHMAAATPRVDIVQDLVHRGATLEAADANKYTPLLIACQFGSADVVGVLVKAGANVHALDVDGNSALMFAAQSKDARKVEILLAAGATVNHRGQGNLTAFAIAVQYKGNPAIDPLRRAGGTK